MLAIPCAGQEVSVATKELPPFVMKDEKGEWEGVSIDIWHEIAEEAGIEYQWVSDDLEGILTGLENGSYDFGVAAITLTSERERKVDFSHPYFSTGLGIAVPAGSEGLDWYGVLKALVSWQFFSALSALALVLLSAGLAVWWFERKENREQFGGKPVQGIGNGFWWSAVTMTTVGYGDKAPVTLGGRLVALVWMFTSIIIISGFTASIATSLTVGSIDAKIKSAEDLQGRLVATLRGSTSEDALRGLQARVLAFDSLRDSLDALVSGEAEAAVYDKPLIQYQLRNYPQLELLPFIFDDQNYAIAIRPGMGLDEAVNVAVLKLEESGVFSEIRRRYGLD